jgi:carbon-monoxide dehydrogenase medium subunit
MRFEYLEVRTAGEAVDLLSKYEGNAKLLAGGTDLVVQMKRQVLRPECVIDITGIRELHYVRYDKGGVLHIGALTTIRSLEKCEQVRRNHRVIAEAAEQLASIGVRNIATLGGNLCNASPSADMAPSLIGLGARAKLIGPKGQREILLEKFFEGPGMTVLERGEILAEIEVPRIEQKTGGVYLKYGIRGSIDLAIVGVAAVVKLGEGANFQETQIVLGAVAPTPMRAKKAEALLRGNKIHEELLEQGARIASEEASPISDVRATADYRKEMVRVFTRKALNEALVRAAKA